MKNTGVVCVREFIVNAADAGTETLASPVPLPPDTRPGFLVFAAIAVFASIPMFASMSSGDFQPYEQWLLIFRTSVAAGGAGCDLTF
jgi:hypothetical protein